MERIIYGDKNLLLALLSTPKIAILNGAKPSFDAEMCLKCMNLGVNALTRHP